MVSLYFGLPGCGKTTLMCYHAMQAVKGKKYKHVYTNAQDVQIEGVTVIDNECIGLYSLTDALILIDEATLFADSRDHKNFGKHQIEFFLLHRHDNVDINLYTQQWDGVDRKIRVITDRCYYIFKTPFTGHWFSCYYRIPYGIIIPDPKDSDGQKLGEIVQGYCKPSLLERIFCKRLYRPKYYQYFDSWARKERPPLPPKYQPYSPTKE